MKLNLNYKLEYKTFKYFLQKPQKNKNKTNILVRNIIKYICLPLYIRAEVCQDGVQGVDRGQIPCTIIAQKIHQQTSQEQEASLICLFCPSQERITALQTAENLPPQDQSNLLRLSTSMIPLIIPRIMTIYLSNAYNQLCQR